MTKATLSILLALLALSTGARADDLLVVELRGRLDRAAVVELRSRMETAWAGAPTDVLIDIDVDSAPGEAGLVLAELLERPPEGVQTAAVITGRAPGAALAVALACSRIYATRDAILGPIPDDDSVRQALAWNDRIRKGPHDLLRRLLAAEGSTGLTASSAEREGLLDGIVADRSGAIGKWGRGGASIKEWEAPATPASEHRAQRLSGPFLKPYLIPIDIPIDDTLHASVKRRVEQGLAEGADLFIFEVDSPGGTVHASMDIGDVLFDLEVPTLVLILKRAHSGAALISLAGREIVMGRGGEIGDCQPISIGTGTYEVLGEKIQSPLRAIFRKFADRNGYPVALAEAMVTQEMEVRRVRIGGEQRYVTTDEFTELEKEYGELTSEVVCKRDQLLTMHAAEAYDLGFCGPPVENREAAYDRYGIAGGSVTRLEETWAERTSRFLLNIKVLLFFGGITALYMELKAPGFGVPGVLALICFALFFSASAIAGISSGIEVVLFLLGVGLLLVEILIIPGFGIPGIAGILCVLLSLYMGSVKYSFGGADRPWDPGAFRGWLMQVCGAILGSIVIGTVIAKFLPRTSFGRKIILSPAGPPGSGGLTGSGSLFGQRSGRLLGLRGVALTDLRPAGRIEIDGEPYDAVTQGGYLARGADVVVLKVQGNRIVVKRTES